MYYIRKLLSDESIQEINELRKHLSWEDGNVSYNGRAGVKNCHQAIYDQFTKQLQEIVYRDLDSDQYFINVTAASESTLILISKYGKGMYYHPHHDQPSLGHYSTTLFLNDDYEGGELNLWTNSEVKKVKLPTGWAVTYDTGTRHCVSEVTKGERDVVIFWTTSRIKNSKDRNFYTRIAEVQRALSNKNKEDKINETLEDCNNDPQFMLREILNLIEREYI